MNAPFGTRSLARRWRLKALRRLAAAHVRGARALRLGALTAAALALACAGVLSGTLAPWTVVALPAGLALAAAWRWGRLALVACTAGVATAMLALGLPPAPALAAVVVVPAAALLAQAAMRRWSFDPRLEHGSDVAALAAAVTFAAALPAALALAVVTSTQGRPGDVGTVSAFVTGWAVLSLGMLLTAVAAFTFFDRGTLQALNRGRPRRDTFVAAASAVLMLALFSAAPMRPPTSGWALFLPPLLATVLALRGHLALAAASLLAAGLLVAARLDSAGAVVLGVWLAAAVAGMLAAHAAAVEWRGRAQRWEWALDGSHLGVADWKLRLPAGQGAFASAAWRALSGHRGAAWSAEAWQAQVHPDDRAALAEALAAVSSGEAGRRRVELRMPLRQEPPRQPSAAGFAASVVSGFAEHWRWVEATLLVIERRSGGQPSRLLATLADVQSRHEAQDRQRMSASLFQHLHEGLLITDADLRALDANPAYTQILGVPREELLGTVPSLLRPTPADPVARQQRAAMWASLRDHGSWRGELLERRRNGEPCTLAATISTVEAPAGTSGAKRLHVLVISDITEQQVQREKLERQAHFDELTRLPNRARLSQLLDDAMRAADRDGYLLVVCYLDLDRFKPVNDQFGHAAGDRLLAELAGRLRSALRSRAQWTDSAARLGGDEFVLLLRAGTLEEARMAVERVLRVVSQPYVIDPAQDPVQITASMGATVYPVDRSDADTLLRHADHAMYSAKQSGRNGYLLFDPEHRRRTEQRVMAIGRIQEALDQQEFVLYYQPKVDMHGGRVLGFEALLRWEHPQQGLVAPLQFLPLIEHTGLSARIGDWVVAQALDHLALWQRSGLGFSVSVNVSARHLQEPDFALRLSELLARHPEPLATHLELEMLETAAHADIEATSALVSRCRAIGVRFALDDFGTGYSTLSYLKRLPVDVLKIDRSFVHHMLDDAQDRAIVEGVIGLARTFGCTVVAEGVESPAQARTLLEMGCSIGQGTGIAAPMPVGQVAAWVRDYKGMFALAPAMPVDAADPARARQP